MGHVFRSRCAVLVGVTTAAVLTVSSVGHAAPAPAAAAGKPPVAVADAATTISGRAVIVRPLANDKDPEGGPLTLRSAQLAAASAGSAALAVAPGGVVRITPKAGFTGRLAAGYVVADAEGLTARGVITVTVAAPPNHPPKPVGDKATVVAGGTVVVTPLANDVDPDKDAMRVLSAASANPRAGTVALASGNRLVIKASAKFTGTFTVRYVVADAHGARAQGAVLVTVTPVPVKPKPVNHAPVARADVVTVFTKSKTRVRVLANDSDPDHDKIKLVSVGKASVGKAKRKGTKIRFTAPKTPGKARITYTIRDKHGATASAVLTVVLKARPVSATPSRANVEAALKRLRLPVGAANGKYDGATRRAVCAWRTITGRTAHRGLPSAAEAKAIVGMRALPKARSVMVTGVTISVTCQAAFWVGKSRQYKRVMAACTGKAGYRTRLGTFRVFRSFNTWRWSTIYPEARMYKPMQFSGGQAMHGSSTDRLVKTYPASHGCVRMYHRDIDALHRGGAGLGTKVRVIGTWKG